MEYKVEPLSRRTIRDYANKIRSVLGLENSLYIPVVESIEKLANLGVIRLEIILKDEMNYKYGETFPSDGLITIREDIYEKAITGDCFARSTFMHEFFHLTHDVSKISFCRSDIEVKKRKTYEDPEWQADCFAGEFLVPKHLVKDMSIEEIMEKCNVSYAMAKCQTRVYQNEGW